MQVPSPNPTTLLMPEFFIVAAGIVNAGFTLPLKRMRTWPWENAWLIWTFTALIIFPVIVAILTIPHLARSYIEADRASLFKNIPLRRGMGSGPGPVWAFHRVNRGCAGFLDRTRRFRSRGSPDSVCQVVPGAALAAHRSAPLFGPDRCCDRCQLMCSCRKTARAGVGWHTESS